jgi:dipeptidyl aminopeptidase/acylaminoacyl peptidase
MLALAPGTNGASTGTNDIWMLPLFGDRKPVAFLEDSKANENRPMFSADGKWLAYESNETGRGEVYVTPIPGPGARVRVSSRGGAMPRWRRDGKELFYLSGRRATSTQLMAATLRVDGGRFDVVDERPLFALNLGDSPVSGYGGQMYDVTADGQRFLVNAVPAAEAVSSLSVIANWTALLKKP